MSKQQLKRGCVHYKAHLPYGRYATREHYCSMPFTHQIGGKIDCRDCPDFRTTIPTCPECGTPLKWSVPFRKWECKECKSSKKTPSQESLEELNKGQGIGW